MPTFDAPVIDPEIVSPRTRQDHAYLVSEENQRAVATWCGGAIGIHGVGVFVTSLDKVIPIGDWLVKENHPDGTSRWVTYDADLFAQVYDVAEAGE